MGCMLCSLQKAIAHFNLLPVYTKNEQWPLIVHNAALSFRRCILSIVHFNIAGETFTLASQEAQSASVG